MSKAKIYMGSWCFAFGFQRPASLEQIVKVLSAFGYDGIGIGAGYSGHAPVERYPDARSRKELSRFIQGHGLEVAVYAPDPYWMPWATSDDAYKTYFKAFDTSLALAADIGSPAMRVDPGSYGPLPRDADYSRIWSRVVSTFQAQAKRAAAAGITLMWEPETSQIFVSPSEILRLLDEVDQPNFKLNLDFAHAHAISVLAHNQLQPHEKLEGGANQLIRMLGRHIGDVGVNDTDGNIVSGIFASHLGLGRGLLDVEGMVKSVIGTGYEGPWWGVDAIPMGEIVWTDAWNDVGALRAMLDRNLPA